MASSNILLFAALLIVAVIPLATFGQNTTDICNQVTCGKGTCKSGLSYVPFGFSCECDSGWKRTTQSSASDETGFEFLPCVIPNCSMNSNCVPAASPVPSITPTILPNISFTDPCALAYCGEGTCKNGSLGYTHTCECNSGATNLLNNTYFPCYTDCAFESSCTQLGFSVNSTSNSNSSSDSANAGHVMSSGQLSWVAASSVLMAFII